MSIDVFPRRNLPPASEPWGRKHDEVSRTHTRGLEDIRLALNGLNRASAGQLGVVGRQIEELERQQTEIIANITELESRSTHSDNPANLQLIRGGSSGESGPVSRIISLPAPQGGQRTATLLGSGIAAWTGTATGGGIADGVTAAIEVRQGTTRRWYDTVQVSSSSVFSFSSQPSFSLAVPVQVPSSGSTWDIRLWVGRSSSGGQENAGTRLEDMVFSVIYGDRY